MHTFCFIYRRLLTHDKTIRIQPTGCYDTIKPRFWLRYHEAPVTDTSIASSCWANTRRGCHRPCLIHSSKGVETPSRGCFLAEWQTILCPSVQNFERKWGFCLDFLEGKSSYLRFLVNYQVENFCWSNFARKEFWQWWLFEQTRIFLRLCSGKVGWDVGSFSFRCNREFGFASTSTNKLPCLLLRRVRLLEFGSNWFDS